MPATNAAASADPADGRFIAGDPLRGLAAIAVLTVHAASVSAVWIGGFGGVHQNALAVLQAAYGTAFASLTYGLAMGLFVFFLLSGYFLGGAYARAAVADRRSQPLTAYTLNRVLRIVPAYWVVLALVTVTFALVLDEVSVSWRDVASLAAFNVDTSNPLMPWLAQVWTLQMEVYFYVLTGLAAVTLFPAVRRLPNRPRLRALVIVVPCVAWLVVTQFVHGTEPPWRGFDYCLGLLLAGVALGAVEPVVRPLVAGSAAVRRAAGWATVVGVAYALAWLWLGENVGSFFFSPTGRLTLCVASIAMVAGPLVAQWASGSSWRLLDNRATHWVGERSYSLYLVHIAVQWAIIELLLDAGLTGYKVGLLIVAPLSLAVSLAIAAVLFRWVERPFLERKRRRRRPRPAPAYAAATDRPAEQGG